MGWLYILPYAYVLQKMKTFSGTNLLLVPFGYDKV